MEMSGLQETLLQLSAHIENKRRQLDYLCRQHKGLLQPWPKNSKKEDDEIKNVSEVISEPKLTVEEQTELDMVQKVLSKAEKARTVYKVTEVKRRKLETAEELRKNVDNSDNTSCILENKTGGGDLDSNKTGENVPDLLNKHQETTSSRESSASDNKTMKKSHDLQNPPKSGKILSNSNTSNKKSFQPNTCISKSLKNDKTCSERVKVPVTFSANNNNRPSRPDNRAKPLKTDVVRVSRPLTSSLKPQYQAHLNAPFKTDPNIKVPSRAKSSVFKQLTGSMMKHSKPASLIKATRHSSAPAVQSDTSQELKQEEKTCDRDVCSNSLALNIDIKQHDLTCDRELQTLCVESNSVSDVTENLPDIRMECHDKVINADEVIDQVTNQISGLSISKETEDAYVGNEMDPNKTFYLIADGSKLSIPKKLRRLYSNNCRLRQKYQALKVTKKVGSDDVSSNLMEKLESEFDAPSDLLNEKQLLLCVHSLTCLLDLLHQQNLTSLTELSSPNEVLHAKMMTEFILTSFDSLQRECSELMSAKVESHFHEEETEIFHNTVLPQWYWLPSNASFGSELPCPASLTYQSKKDVSKFHCATFQLQYLQLQATLIKSVKKQILPLLHNLDPSSREFIQIFRAVYALLTSDGQHQPGVVRETLDEELASTGYR